MGLMTERADQVRELKIYFASQKMPKEIQLGEGVRIVDIPKFLASHITIAELPDPRGVNEVFFLRLLQLNEVLRKMD